MISTTNENHKTTLFYVDFDHIYFPPVGHIIEILVNDVTYIIDFHTQFANSTQSLSQILQNRGPK